MNYLILVFPVIALAGIIIVLCTLPVRIKKLEKQVGPCQLVLTRRTSKMFIGVVVTAILVPIVMIIRPFELLYTAILCATSVLGVEVVLREHVYEARCGIYSNALIVDGRYLEREDIIDFPEFHYEKEDDSDADSDELYARALKIVSKKSGEVYVGFASREEKEAAVKLLENW